MIGRRQPIARPIGSDQSETGTARRRIRNGEHQAAGRGTMERQDGFARGITVLGEPNMRATVYGQNSQTRGCFRSWRPFAAWVRGRANHASYCAASTWAFA